VLFNDSIWENVVRPWFSLKINGVEHEIYNHVIGKIRSYTVISIKRKEIELVTRWADVKDHISNNENVNVTEIKWDPLGDNLPVTYEDFYEFNNKKGYIYLFRKNEFFDNVAYYWTILKKNKVK
jgi:hypothetical protein